MGMWANFNEICLTGVEIPKIRLSRMTDTINVPAFGVQVISQFSQRAPDVLAESGSYLASSSYPAWPGWCPQLCVRLSTQEGDVIKVVVRL